MTEAQRDQQKETALVHVLEAIQKALICYGPDALVAHNLYKAAKCIQLERSFLAKAWEA